MEEARPGPIYSAQVRAMPPVPTQRRRPVLLAEALCSLPLLLDKRLPRSLSSAISALPLPQVPLRPIRPSLLPHYSVSQPQQPAKLRKRIQSLRRTCSGQPRSQPELSLVADQVRLHRLSLPQAALARIFSVAELHQLRRLVRNQLAYSEPLPELRPRRRQTSSAAQQPLQNLQSQLLARALHHFLVQSPLRQQHQPAARRRLQPSLARACLLLLLLAARRRPRNHPLYSRPLRPRPRLRHLQLHPQRPLRPLRPRHCSVGPQRRPLRLRAQLQAQRPLPRQL